MEETIDEVEQFCQGRIAQARDTKSRDSLGIFEKANLLGMITEASGQMFSTKADR